jgi:group I intron endonuclease
MPWFIYKITNLVNRKIYIGKTDDIEHRWYGHCYDAKHSNGFYFQHAIRKYGEEAFAISILEAHKDEQIAFDREKTLIKELNTRDPRVGYNIAEGGLGGNTMTQEQIEAQHSIKNCDYSKFIEAFNIGLTQGEIAKLFKTGIKGVINCARRLDLSFKNRRSLKLRKITKEVQNKDVIAFLQQKFYQKEALRTQRRQERLRHLKILRESRKMSPEVYSHFRAKIMTRVNKTRGISDEMKQRVIDLYFGSEEMTAKEIANQLQIGHGSVRRTINCAYAAMNDEDRKNVKKRRASSVRSGDRNPRSLSRVA